MSLNPLSLLIKKDTDTVLKTVLTNIIKMLSYRNWLNKDNLDKNIELITSSNNNNTNNDNIYKIKLDVNLEKFPFYDTETKNFNGNVVVVKILQQYITGVNKSLSVTDFLNNYNEYHKILIVDKISEKAQQQLDEMPGIEVFLESFFMINLVEHVCSPNYEILNKDETEKFLSSYQVTKRNLCKMDISDPASKYLYVKKGQIVRIIRNSELAGQTIGYRVIINKGNNKI